MTTLLRPCVLFVSRGTREVGGGHDGLRMKRGHAAAGLGSSAAVGAVAEPCSKRDLPKPSHEDVRPATRDIGIAVLGSPGFSCTQPSHVAVASSDTIDTPLLTAAPTRGTTLGTACCPYTLFPSAVVFQFDKPCCVHLLRSSSRKNLASTCDLVWNR
jgi:hypothetical protein